MLNIPPRCMKTTIKPELVNMITEEQNKQQYESFITSCVHGGQFDAIVSYKEWLETIQGYKPQLPTTDTEYSARLEAMQNLTR